MKLKLTDRIQLIIIKQAIPFLKTSDLYEIITKLNDFPDSDIGKQKIIEVIQKEFDKRGEMFFADTKF